jgi:hypothetical protein
MLHNTLNGRTVYVVDFDTMPELPITGLTEEEAAYENSLEGGSFPQGSFWTLARLFAGRRITYAEALTDAIETGVIFEPGKYGIYLKPGPDREYEIYTIVD